MLSKKGKSYKKFVVSGDMTSSYKVKKGGNLKTLDAKPGLYTRYKSYLSTDKAMLKRLAKVTSSC